MENIVKQHQIVDQWKPFLEDERFGHKVKRSDQTWVSQCLHNMVSESIKTDIGKHIFKDRTKSPVEVITEAETFSTAYSSAGTGYSGVDTIAAYGKLLPMIFRRAATQLIAPAFTGVQPMAGPQAFYVAMKSRYVGRGTHTQIPISQGVIFVVNTSVDAVANWAPDTTTAISGFGAANAGHVTQLTSGATGIVRYAEGTKILVEHVPASAAFTDTPAHTLSVASGSDVRTVVAKFDHERGYKRFFKNYSYGGTTPDWDTLGSQNTATMSGRAKEITEIGIDFEKFPVVVNDRKLKTTFDVAQMEDLRNNLGLNMQDEASMILVQEMLLEMNRELIANIRGVATAAGSFNVNTGSDGRWHMEKIRGLYLQLASQAQAIWEDTRVAPGNKLLVSKNVLVALSALPDFKLAPVDGAVGLGQTFAGNIGGFEVHVDIFAEDEFALTAFKGENQLQAGYYYLPYIPLEVAQAKHPDVLWDNILGIRTRYAYAENPFGGELFYRDLTVDGLSAIGIG